MKSNFVLSEMTYQEITVLPFSKTMLPIFPMFPLLLPISNGNKSDSAECIARLSAIKIK